MVPKTSQRYQKQPKVGTKNSPEVPKTAQTYKDNPNVPKNSPRDVPTTTTQIEIEQEITMTRRTDI